MALQCVCRMSGGGGSPGGSYQVNVLSRIFLWKLSRCSPCSDFQLRNQAEHVHDRAQANEPARPEEERLSEGVGWKFVAGLFGDRAERQRLGEADHVSPESDQSPVRGLHCERGRVGAAN